MKIRDSHSRVSRTQGLIGLNDAGTEWEYLDGMVETPRGFVAVYSCGGLAILRFIHKGYEHRRTFERTKKFTRKGLARMAAIYAKGCMS